MKAVLHDFWEDGAFVSYTSNNGEESEADPEPPCSARCLVHCTLEHRDNITKQTVASPHHLMDCGVLAHISATAANQRSQAACCLVPLLQLPVT